MAGLFVVEEQQMISVMKFVEALHIRKEF